MLNEATEDSYLRTNTAPNIRYFRILGIFEGSVLFNSYMCIQKADTMVCDHIQPEEISKFSFENLKSSC